MTSLSGQIRVFYSVQTGVFVQIKTSFPCSNSIPVLQKLDTTSTPATDRERGTGREKCVVCECVYSVCVCACVYVCVCVCVCARARVCVFTSIIFPQIAKGFFSLSEGLDPESTI